MRSIELGWIARRAKDLPLPNIVFTSKLPDCGGCYYKPQHGGVYVDLVRYDLSHGLIVIADDGDDHTGSTIAHEWRHHWQLFNLGDCKAIGWGSVLASSVNYEAAIKRYYRGSSTEMDALLFQHKYSPSKTTDYWFGLLDVKR